MLGPACCCDTSQPPCSCTLTPLLTKQNNDCVLCMDFSITSDCPEPVDKLDYAADISWQLLDGATVVDSGTGEDLPKCRYKTSGVTTYTLEMWWTGGTPAVPCETTSFPTVGSPSTASISLDPVCDGCGNPCGAGEEFLLGLTTRSVTIDGFAATKTYTYRHVDSFFVEQGITTVRYLNFNVLNHTITEDYTEYDINCEGTYYCPRYAGPAKVVYLGQVTLEMNYVGDPFDNDYEEVWDVWSCLGNYTLDGSGVPVADTQTPGTCIPSDEGAGHQIYMKCASVTTNPLPTGSDSWDGYPYVNNPTNIQTVQPINSLAATVGDNGTLGLVVHLLEPGIDGPAGTSEADTEIVRPSPGPYGIPFGVGDGCWYWSRHGMGHPGSLGSAGAPVNNCSPLIWEYPNHYRSGFPAGWDAVLDPNPNIGEVLVEDGPTVIAERY